jgi:capsular polysaccharide transport system permease protein
MNLPAFTRSLLPILRRQASRFALVPQQRATLTVGTGGGHGAVVQTLHQRLESRRRRRMLIFGLFVALPTLISTLYFGMIASGRYVSDTRMLVSSGSGGGGGVGSLLAIIGMKGGSDNLTDQRVMLNDYLLSSDAMHKVNQMVGLRKMWGNDHIDWFSRLGAHVSDEQFLSYYRSHIHINYDSTQPVIQLDVEAFRPQDAQKIATALVTIGQAKINQAFSKIREDSLSFARHEVAGAEKQLADSNEALTNFRNLHGDLSPDQTAKAVGGLASGMYAEVAKLRAQLQTERTFMREDSPQIRMLRARIVALNEQIQHQRGLLAGKNGNATDYANLLNQYQGLVLAQKFAQKAYVSALTFLETSRADAMRQHAYIVDFVPPTLPDQATEPRRLRNIVFVFFASLLVVLIGSLITSAMREHSHF